MFSDRIERFIPPKKGRQHILKIIRELIDFKPESQVYQPYHSTPVPGKCDQKTDALFF